MKLLYANIGGASGYANSMNWFKEQLTANLPCIFAVNECGNDEKLRNLQPFFNLEQKNGRVCLHDCDVSRKLMKDTTIDTECVYTKIKFKMFKKPGSTVKECWFCCTYRPDKMNKDEFTAKTTKLIKKLINMGPANFVLTGDFNMTPDDNAFHQLLYNLNAIKVGKFMHKHRKHTKPNEIDFVLTNLSPEMIETESIGSFETINNKNDLLGHKAILIKLGKWDDEFEQFKTKKTDWKLVHDKLKKLKPEWDKSEGEEMAKALNDWIIKCIEDSSNYKKVKIKKKFDTENLMVPVENDRASHPWKMFYSAVKMLKKNEIRHISKGINNNQFRDNLEAKLKGFPNVDLKMVKSYIDKCTENWQLIDDDKLVTNTKEVRDIITNLSSSGAKDLNGVSVKELKELKDNEDVLYGICRVWKQMCKEKMWPKCMKRDKIIYLYKNKGERCDPSKYRPITIVIGISKIFEELLRRRIVKYLPDFGQGINHAYKAKHNCQTAVLDVDKFVNKKKKGWVSCAVFIDLRGAYESVEHRILEYLMGKKSTCLAGVCKGYVTRRHASITDNEDKSNDVQLRYRKNRSIPQGSIISPWLFRQYCGLFGSWFKNCIGIDVDHEIAVVGYADDHVILCNAINEKVAKKSVIENVHLFGDICKKFGVAFAPEKTEILLRNVAEWDVLGKRIKTANEIVWLGYTITLNSRNLIEYIIPNKKKFALDNLVTTFCKYNSNICDRRVFYMTYIKPCIDYTLVCLNCKEELFRIEARLVKKCIGVELTATSKEAILLFGIHDTYYRTGVMAYKMLESGVLGEHFKMVSNTRSGHIKPAIDNGISSLVDKLTLMGKNFSHGDTIKFDLDLLLKWKDRESQRVQFYASRGTDRDAYAKAPSINSR